MNYDDDGLRLRQVTDIAADHSEIDLSCGKCLGGFERGTSIGHLKSDGALIEVSRPATADIALAASPSIEPTAIVSVTGRV